MNIQTATIYATHGYKIYRNPSWVDSDTGEVCKNLTVMRERNGSLSYMFDAAHYAILSPEDCLADDWEIIR